MSSPAESLSTPQPTHPFDELELGVYLEKTYPERAEAIAMATRPGLSDQPSELEQWEADRILERKQRMPSEAGDDKMYLRRLLYEEAFSVNQRPGLSETFQGSAGMTPGGLISHYYPEFIPDGKHLGEVLAMPELDETSLAEAIRKAKERDFTSAYTLADMIGSLSQQGDIFSGLYDRRLGRAILDGRGNTELYEAVGFRMLKMFRAAPEMLEPVEDQELKSRFGLQIASFLTRAGLMGDAWKKSQAILPEGYYTHADTPEIQTAVDNLLALRTSEDMQVFFRYLSPSGYIDQAS